MKLAWKEMKHSKSRYLLIEGIILLMMFMVLFLSGLANGLARAVSASVENMNVTQFIVSEGSQDMFTLSSISTEDVETLRAQYGSEMSPFQLQRMNVYAKDQSTKLDITYIAIEEGSFLQPSIMKGNGLTAGQNEILLDDAFTEEGYEIGDVIRDVSSGVELTVVGFVKDEMYGHTSAGFITTDTYVAIRSAISSNYQPSYHAVAIRGTVDQLPEGLVLRDKGTIVSNLPGYTAEQTTINMILWVLVVISAAILGVFFYIMTLQKQKQFGVMKAIGLSMGEIRRTIMSQVAMLSLTGVCIGNGLTYMMASMLPASMPFYIKNTDMTLVSCVFVAISIICSLLSTRQVAKVDPIISIGGNA